MGKTTPTNTPTHPPTPQLQKNLSAGMLLKDNQKKVLE